MFLITQKEGTLLNTFTNVLDMKGHIQPGPFFSVSRVHLKEGPFAHTVPNAVNQTHTQSPTT